MIELRAERRAFIFKKSNVAGAGDHHNQMTTKAFGPGARGYSLVRRAEKAIEKRIPVARMNEVGAPLWLDLVKKYPPFKPSELESQRLLARDLFRTTSTSSSSRSRASSSAAAAASAARAGRTPHSHSPPSTAARSAASRGDEDRDDTTTTDSEARHPARSVAEVARDHISVTPPLASREPEKFEVQFTEDELLRDFVRQNPTVIRLTVIPDRLWPPLAFVKLQAVVMQRENVGEKEAFERVLGMRDWEFYFNLYYNRFKLEEVGPSGANATKKREIAIGAALREQIETTTTATMKEEGGDEEPASPGNRVSRKEWSARKKGLKETIEEGIKAADEEGGSNEATTTKGVPFQHVFITRPGIKRSLKVRAKTILPKGADIGDLDGNALVRLEELHAQHIADQGNPIERYVHMWSMKEAELWRGVKQTHGYAEIAKMIHKEVNQFAQEERIRVDRQDAERKARMQAREKEETAAAARGASGKPWGGQNLNRFPTVSPGFGRGQQRSSQSSPSSSSSSPAWQNQNKDNRRAPPSQSAAKKTTTPREETISSGSPPSASTPPPHQHQHHPGPTTTTQKSGEEGAADSATTTKAKNN